MEKSPRLFEDRANIQVQPASSGYTPRKAIGESWVCFAFKGAGWADACLTRRYLSSTTCTYISCWLDSLYFWLNWSDITASTQQGERSGNQNWRWNVLTSVNLWFQEYLIVYACQARVFAQQFVIVIRFKCFHFVLGENDDDAFERKFSDTESMLGDDAASSKRGTNGGFRVQD